MTDVIKGVRSRTTRRARKRCVVFAVSLLLVCAACGARDAAVDAGQPAGGANAPPAPVLLTIGEEREAAVRAAWATLLREQGVVTNNPVPALPLFPLTYTVASLPALPAPLRLPRIGDPNAAGDARAANERESLRRFLNSTATITGATGETTTLVRIADIADSAPNSRRAIYEQRPFVYPLRGGFGSITVDYTSDLRVLNLSSTALPAADTANTRLRSLQARLTADEARAVLAGKTIRLRDGGAIVERALPNDAEELRQAARVTELVVYPVARATEAGGRVLDLRLAWEFRIDDADRFAYVDAIGGEILDAAPPDVENDRRSAFTP